MITKSDCVKQAISTTLCILMHSFDENGFKSCPLFGRTNGYAFCIWVIGSAQMKIYSTFHIPSQHLKCCGRHLNATIFTYVNLNRVFFQISI